ncbi:MAG: RNA polymerase sigma factor [Armatimonadetes bacterium]|nr:RNA polymerase sigma factor [Armatimonadota bacterium]
MTRLEELSGPSLWAVQFANGDRREEERLAVHVREFLRRRFLSLGLAAQDAEDLLQDCVALVFDTIDEFDVHRGNLDAWLSGYAKNVVRSWWRGSYSRKRRETVLCDGIETPDSSEPILAGSPALETALSDLSLIDQELLHMRFAFGYSFDEIARMSDLTPINARKRVSRAVETLRRNPGLREELGFVA